MKSIQKIEHIGIAVQDIDVANRIYEQLLGIAPYQQETVESEGVITSFFQVGESKIELLAASTEESPIQKFLDTRGEGIHHIAFAVADIQKEMKRLATEGFQVLNTVPKVGADNKLVAFVHPKDTHGVLIELCQDIT